jgi:nucleoside-diphosphate-sugar epimerase
MRILVTGAAGYVGRRVARELSAAHEVRGGDLRPPPNDPAFLRLDITRFDEVLEATRGCDAVVHLAVASGHEGECEEPAFNQLRFDVNVKGTWNVLEAARQTGVRRVVYTSSLMVVWGYPPPEWVAGDAPPRPVGTYAVTKQLGEVMCRHYAEQHGVSIVCLRISKPIDPDDPAWRGKRVRPQWLAFGDLTRAYRLAVERADIGFEIVTLVGDSSRRRWDLGRAETVLGYCPTLRLEDLGFELGGEREPF